MLVEKGPALVVLLNIPLKSEETNLHQLHSFLPRPSTLSTFEP